MSRIGSHYRGGVRQPLAREQVSGAAVFLLNELLVQLLAAAPAPTPPESNQND